MALVLLAPHAASAQGIGAVLNDPRPVVGVERPEAPSFEEASPGLPALDALPLETAPAQEGAALASGLRVAVGEIRVEGSTVFSEEELAALAAPYAHRVIDSAELVELREAITRAYIERGYVSSGAFIPDQDLGDDATVVVEVVEGRLVDVLVTGNDGYRAHYFRSRLLRAGRTPVNVHRIEEVLQQFQQEPLIARVSASLQPGAERGESVLALHVEEAGRVELTASATNRYSPALGGEGGEFVTSFSNIAGFGDKLLGAFNLASGLRDYYTRYAVPVTRYDTILAAYYRWVESEIVTLPASAPAIENQFEAYGISLDQPVYRSPSHSVAVGAIFEQRRSNSTIAESCIDLVQVCDPVVTALRLSSSWSWRLPRDGIAFYHTLSFGLDALGSTISDVEGEPDSDYFAWLAQAQWARRFDDPSQSRMVTRFAIQLATSALISSERFAIGGIDTVRGYPQNQFVRDNGFAASLEWWIPVWRDGFGSPLVELVPFFDVGRVWNDSQNLESQPDETLASLGFGIRVTPISRVSAELYWGAQLVDVYLEGDDIQNHGLHFAIRVTAF